MKKIISCLLMLLASVSVALAQMNTTPSEPTVGDGSKENPYQITSANELVWYRDYVNSGAGGNSNGKSAKLMADIDLSGVCNTTNGSWEPLCPYVNSWFGGTFFYGVFDGNGHKIKNLYLVIDNNYCGGFVGGMSGGEIKNVTFENATLKSRSSVYSAIVVGLAENEAQITNCVVSGSVEGPCDVAGIVGYAERGAVISGCANNASVEASEKGYCGGIVSSCDLATITGCVNNGNVTSTYYDGYYYISIGGIVGYINTNETVIDRCQNTGTITSVRGYAGGIVAVAGGSKVSNCWNGGDIVYTNSNNNTRGEGAGIVGTGVATIEYCLNTGSVSMPNITAYDNNNLEYSRLIIGSQDINTITDCFSAAGTKVTWGDEQPVTYQVEGAGMLYRQENNGTHNRFTARFASATQLLNGEVAWILQAMRAETIWGQQIGTDELPKVGSSKRVYLKGQLNCDGQSYADGTTFQNTAVTEKIASHTWHADRFCKVCRQGEEPALVDGVYQITSPGNLIWFNDNLKTEYSAVMTADVDLSNYCNRSVGTWDNNATTCVGYFDGQNHSIKGLYVDPNNSSYGKGALFYKVQGTVKNLTVHATILPGYSDGGSGIIAGLNNGTIENCTTHGSVTGDASGGVVGQNYGKIINCVNYATVSMENGTSIGGIAGSLLGSNGDCKVVGCVNHANVKAGSSVGGIVGRTSNNCLFEVTDCKNYGLIEGDGSVGGIVGTSSGYDLSKITGCANHGEVKSRDNYVAGVVGYVGSPAVTHCANYGTISGNMSVGGVIGMAVASKEVTSLYNAGTVTGHSGGPVFGSANPGSETIEGNNYYKAGCTMLQDVVMASEPSAQDLTSGRITYLLGVPFGQDLATETQPMLGSKQVYWGRYEQCNDTPKYAENTYTNSPLYESPNHVVGETAQCELCHAAITDICYGQFADWESDNQYQPSTTATKTWNINASANYPMTFSWTVSSETRYDKLKIVVKKDGVVVAVLVNDESGEQEGTVKYTFPSAGEYQLVATYSKDGSGDTGGDKATVNNLKVAHTKMPLGDMDNNGKLTARDASLLIDFLTGGSTEDPYKLSDVDGNTSADKNDVKALVDKILGK